jgi:peptidoglycan/LPS O-acetylase OafA/YrhL
LGNLFFLATLGVGLYFAFFVLRPDLTLAEQWSLYINPFNNFFLYVLGITIYYNFKDVSIKPTLNNILLLVAILLFSLLPYGGNQISLVSGFGRLVFVALSFIIVFCFYKLSITLPKFLGNTLETFGIATYGVYMLHPVVFVYSNFILKAINIRSGVLLFGMVSLLTIVLAISSYRIFETRMIKLGKKLTSTSLRQGKA